jgi:hypothetical protein
MKAFGWVGVYINVLLTSALVGDERSASRPCRFTPGERAPGFDWKGGPQNRCERSGKVKIVYSAGTRNLTPRWSSPQPVALSTARLRNRPDSVLLATSVCKFCRGSGFCTEPHRTLRTSLLPASMAHTRLTTMEDIKWNSRAELKKIPTEPFKQWQDR